MEQCKKHGYYVCPHCIEKENTEPTLNPYKLKYDEIRQSERDSYEQYARKIGLKQ